MAEELRWIAESGASGVGGAASPVAAKRGARAGTLLAGVALLAAGLAAGFAVASSRGRAAPAALVQSSILLPRGAEFSPTGENDRVVLAPDGRTLAFDSAASFRLLAISPDRRSMALEVDDKATGFDLWIVELATGRMRRLTLRGSGSQPAWSPDGRRVAYVGADGSVYVRFADGQGEPELLFRNGNWGGPAFWSPDGRHLSFWRFDPASPTGFDAFVLPLEGRRELVPVAATEAAEIPLGFAADGRWLAYESDATGRNEVYLASFPDLRRRVQVSLTGGTAATWAGPRELWYRQPDGTWVAVTLEEREGAPLHLSPPRVLLRDAQIRWLESSAEGDRFLALRERTARGTPQIVLVNDWRRLLERGER